MAPAGCFSCCWRQGLRQASQRKGLFLPSWQQTLISLPRLDGLSLGLQVSRNFSTLERLIQQSFMALTEASSSHTMSSPNWESLLECASLSIFYKLRRRQYQQNLRWSRQEVGLRILSIFLSWSMVSEQGIFLQNVLDFSWYSSLERKKSSIEPQVEFIQESDSMSMGSSQSLPQNSFWTRVRFKGVMLYHPMMLQVYSPQICDFSTTSTKLPYTCRYYFTSPFWERLLSWLQSQSCRYFFSRLCPFSCSRAYSFYIWLKPVTNSLEAGLLGPTVLRGPSMKNCEASSGCLACSENGHLTAALAGSLKALGQSRQRTNIYQNCSIHSLMSHKQNTWGLAAAFVLGHNLPLSFKHSKSSRHTNAINPAGVDYRQCGSRLALEVGQTIIQAQLWSIQTPELAPQLLERAAVAFQQGCQFALLLEVLLVVLNHYHFVAVELAGPGHLPLVLLLVLPFGQGLGLQLENAAQELPFSVLGEQLNRKQHTFSLRSLALRLSNLISWSLYSLSSLRRCFCLASWPSVSSWALSCTFLTISSSNQSSILAYQSCRRDSVCLSCLLLLLLMLQREGLKLLMLQREGLKKELWESRMADRLRGVSRQLLARLVTLLPSEALYFQDLERRRSLRRVRDKRMSSVLADSVKKGFWSTSRSVRRGRRARTAQAGWKLLILFLQRLISLRFCSFCKGSMWEIWLLQAQSSQSRHNGQSGARLYTRLWFMFRLTSDSSTLRACRCTTLFFDRLSSSIPQSSYMRKSSASSNSQRPRPLSTRLLIFSTRLLESQNMALWRMRLRCSLVYDYLAGTCEPSRKERLPLSELSDYSGFFFLKAFDI